MNPTIFDPHQTSNMEANNVGTSRVPNHNYETNSQVNDAIDSMFPPGNPFSEGQGTLIGGNIQVFMHSLVYRAIQIAVDKFMDQSRLEKVENWVINSRNWPKAPSPSSNSNSDWDRNDRLFPLGPSGDGSTREVERDLTEDSNSGDSVYDGDCDEGGSNDSQMGLSYQSSSNTDILEFIQNVFSELPSLLSMPAAELEEMLGSIIYKYCPNIEFDHNVTQYRRQIENSGDLYYDDQHYGQDPASQFPTLPPPYYQDDRSRNVLEPIQQLFWMVGQFMYSVENARSQSISRPMDSREDHGLSNRIASLRPLIEKNSINILRWWNVAINELAVQINNKNLHSRSFSPTQIRPSEEGPRVGISPSRSFPSTNSISINHPKMVNIIQSIRDGGIYSALFNSKDDVQVIYGIDPNLEQRARIETIESTDSEMTDLRQIDGGGNGDGDDGWEDYDDDAETGTWNDQEDQPSDGQDERDSNNLETRFLFACVIRNLVEAVQSIGQQESDDPKPGFAVEDRNNRQDRSSNIVSNNLQLSTEVADKV